MRLSVLQGRRRRISGVLPLLDEGLGGGLLLEQPHIAVILGDGIIQLGFRRRHFGLGLLQLSLVLVLLNGEEEIAFLHGGAVSEVDFFEIPLDRATSFTVA